MPLWAYLTAVPVFGLLILVHELGHYIGARGQGIDVAEFAVGFGPRIFGFTAQGTVWSLRLIPLGGYVRWHDEGAGAFTAKGPAARAWALFAGPLANLLLTMLVLVVFLVATQGYGWNSLIAAGRFTFMMAAGWFQAMGSLFLGGQGLADLTGPVGIAQAAAEVVVAGVDQFLLFTAFLSLNIGLFNLLPVPGLDGGRLVLLGLERLRRRPLDPLVEGWIHAGGFLLLIGVLIFTTVKDFLA